MLLGNQLFADNRKEFAVYEKMTNNTTSMRSVIPNAQIVEILGISIIIVKTKKDHQTNLDSKRYIVNSLKFKQVWVTKNAIVKINGLPHE